MPKLIESIADKNAAGGISRRGWLSEMPGAHYTARVCQPVLSEVDLWSEGVSQWRAFSKRLGKS